MNNNSQKYKKSVSKKLCYAKLFFVFVISITSSVAYSSEIKEQHIKAAFLYNLYRFVTWPDRTPPSPENPVQYCVLGSGEIDKLLEGTVKSRERTKKRAIAFKRINQLSEIEGCDLLFISDNSGIPLTKVFGEVKNKAIVTVGAASNFAKEGGMINLLQKNKRIHVIINMDVVDSSNLKISSKVKRLSKIISSK